MLEKLHEKCNRTAKLYLLLQCIRCDLRIYGFFSLFSLHIILAAFYFHARTSECGLDVMVYTKTHFVIGFAEHTTICNVDAQQKPSVYLVCHTWRNILMCSSTGRALLSVPLSVLSFKYRGIWATYIHFSTTTKTIYEW